jgi:ATP-dependent exoDNAse (exonuclease V) beta subunit
MDLLLSRAVLPADLAASWSDVIDQKTWSFVDDAGALWKFPALRPESESLANEETEGPDLPEPEEIARAASALQAKREEAQARMDRPFSGAASEEAHHLLREEQAEARVAPEVEEARQRRKGKRTPELDREAAMAAGGAIHRVLETWDLTADPRKEAGRQRSLLPEYLAALVEGEILDQALPRALDLLDQFLEGPLLARFRNLDGHVLARELPVLLPPTESPTAPIGVIAGAIDLLYRDPKTKALIIADYKTDDLETESDLNRRAATYAHQGAVYVRALQDALELPDLPRFELWFLRAGRVVEA